MSFKHQKKTNLGIKIKSKSNLEENTNLKVQERVRVKMKEKNQLKINIEIEKNGKLDNKLKLGDKAILDIKEKNKQEKYEKSLFETKEKYLLSSLKEKEKDKLIFKSLNQIHYSNINGKGRMIINRKNEIRKKKYIY